MPIWAQDGDSSPETSSGTQGHAFSWNPTGESNMDYWWLQVPANVLEKTVVVDPVSNIRRQDYVGAESCQGCHETKHEQWMDHAHRRMNALALPENVVGDFSGVTLDYKGGEARFVQVGSDFHMLLKRGDISRRYRVIRTIGSRFFQYYTGILLDGPESQESLMRSRDIVLPFGYWIQQKAWVPVVHVGTVEAPDEERFDPFAAPEQISDVDRVGYDAQCAKCHTTRPMGDWMLGFNSFSTLEDFLPWPTDFLASDYLKENHSRFLAPQALDSIPDAKQFIGLMQEFDWLPSMGFAVNLGISCEACHHGGREHVAQSTKESSNYLPSFFPTGPHVRVEGVTTEHARGRSAEVLNWTCAKCHSGARPYFESGMATWNSTEFSDASKGACYSPPPGSKSQALTCVHCHDPHKTIGPAWTPTPAEDDARCLSCHSQFNEPRQLEAHTHHLAGSSGSRCMDCHMPHFNEGLQDVVRTHMIHSPTRTEMIEVNQPNACNLCHLDQPIDWTLKYLKEWYRPDLQVDEALMAKHYPNRTGPVGLGWIRSEHESTRLVAGAAIARQKATWALPLLIEQLDDPFLLNRQFALKEIQDWFGVDLSQAGYRFYDSREERQMALPAVTRRLQVPTQRSEARP